MFKLPERCFGLKKDTKFCRQWTLLCLFLIQNQTAAEKSNAENDEYIVARENGKVIFFGTLGHSAKTIFLLVGTFSEAAICFGLS